MQAAAEMSNLGCWQHAVGSSSSSLPMMNSMGGWSVALLEVGQCHHDCRAVGRVMEGQLLLLLMVQGLACCMSCRTCCVSYVSRAPFHVVLKLEPVAMCPGVRSG
jgi:hypothetical protein